MKVLLLGDYSSLHKYLYDGLKQIEGVEVDFASNGDGWKKIDSMNELYPTCHSGMRGLFDRLIVPFFKLSKYRGYDIVQFINPVVYPWLINATAIKKICKQNSHVSLVAAGDDIAVIEAYKRGVFRFYIYDYAPEVLNDYLNGVKGIFLRISNKIMLNNADMIIPSLFEYAIGYNCEKRAQTIPFPINTDEIEYQPNIVGNKIKIFHGISRSNVKGTPKIKEAMERIARDYPNDVEIIYAERMPQAEYMELMRTSNVVVDQCYGYGYGINACIAMAMGKVVLSSCQKETIEDFAISETPLISIDPNVGSIYNALKMLVNNRQSIHMLGEKSRAYIEKEHDYIRVANKYLTNWSKILK